jgi:hypothetical protein
MTRQAQKDEERFYAMEYLRRRGIDGRVADTEHPDFLIYTSSGTLGIEVISYGANRGRQVDSAWGALQEHSDKFRERNPDLRRFGVRLHFRAYRMPPDPAHRRHRADPRELPVPNRSLRRHILLAVGVVCIDERRNWYKRPRTSRRH